MDESADDIHPSLSYYWEFLRHEFVLVRIGPESEGPGGCLIHNLWDCSYVVIEDERVARAIKNRMSAAGVPVVARDDVPVGTSRAQQVWEAMHAGRITRDQAERQIKLLSDAEARRREWIRRHCGE